LLRTAEACTAEELQRTIAVALGQVRAQEAVDWFASFGYSII
jgi:hypothetical protein